MPENTLITFIETRMDKLKITYHDLSKASNVSLSTLNAIKRGGVVYEPTLKRLCKPLKCEIDDLLSKMPKVSQAYKKVRVTKKCEYCNRIGTVYTIKPEKIKYTHSKCVSAVALSQSKENTLKQKIHIKSKEFHNIDKITQNPVLLKTIENYRLRPCMKCKKEFLSTWNGHRICKKCKVIMESEFKGSVYEHKIVMSKGRGSI